MTQNKTRLLWLDALKGIGILSIMRVHMMAPMELLQSVVYVGAVAMFFVLAGFHLKRPVSLLPALRGKARRLLVPYFLYSVLLLCVEHRLDNQMFVHLLGIFYARMQLFVPGTADNVSFLVIGNAPMWFLPCMFLAFVWVYGLYFRCTSASSRVLVCTGFVLLSALQTYSPILLPWSIDTSFLCAALMVIGYECRRHFLSGRMVWAGMAFMAWMLLFSFFGGSNISIGIYGAYGALSIVPFMLIAIAETYALASLLQWLENLWMTRVLAYIGQHSLRLMCIHLVIYFRAFGFIERFLPDYSESRWVVLPLAFAIIFAVDAVIEWCSRRFRMAIPLVKYL